MGIIKRLFGVNAKAKAMLRKLPILDKASVIKEVKGLSIGDYGGVSQVQIEKAADAIAHGIRSGRHRVVCKTDRIPISDKPSLASVNSETTIFRIAEEEFVFHLFFDTEGH